jgi:hypothetical protein
MGRTHTLPARHNELPAPTVEPPATSAAGPDAIWSPEGRVRFALTYVVCLATVAAVVALIWVWFERPALGVDDAYIFFVYARNLIDGDGFVYNRGGEAIEGFTSLLWTLICGIAFRVTWKPLELLLGLNIALVALTGGVVVQAVRALATMHRRRTWIAAAFGLALLTEFGYVTWNTLTLMDNALWSTQLTLLTVLSCLGDATSRRRSAGVALLTATLVLTRPEAMVWAPLFIVILTLRAAQRTTVRSALLVGLLPSAAFALTLGGLTAFRLVYFGYPLPNTFYAKMSPALGYTLSQGLRYLAGYAATLPLPFLVSAGVGLGVLHVVIRDRWLRTPGAPLLVPAAAGLALPVLTGGDHFSAYRFYQNVLPILVLGLAFTTLRVLPPFLAARSWPAAPRLQTVSALTALGLGLAAARAIELRLRAHDSQLRVEFHIAERERASGVRMSRLFDGLPAPPSVGVITAGGLKYEYEGDVVDLMGLNNLHIAHNGGRRIGLKNHAAFEKASLYELQPDLVAPTLVDRSSWRYSPGAIHGSFNNEVLRGIFDDAAFRSIYRFCLITERGPGRQPALAVWVHHRRLQELHQQPRLDVREFGS